MNGYPGKLILLSGAFGSGKTTLLLMLLEELKSNGLKITGVLSPPILQDGEKVGILLQDIGTGRISQLAVLRGIQSDTAITTTHWTFSPEGMKEADHILSQAVPGDLLIVDELGPLEFERQAGWVNGLAAIDSRQYSMAVCVIRPSLIDLALTRWPDAQVIVMTRETQREIVQKIKNLALESNSNARSE